MNKSEEEEFDRFWHEELMKPVKNSRGRQPAITSHRFLKALAKESGKDIKYDETLAEPLLVNFDTGEIRSLHDTSTET